MSVAKRQLAAGPHDAGERGQVLVRDEAALALAPLRPGIGIEQVDPVERGRRAGAAAARSRRRRRCGCCRAPPARSTAEELGHAVDEGLAADEADVRIGRGACASEMLAAAEADLEPDLVDRRAGTARRGRATGRRRQREPQARAAGSRTRSLLARRAAPCPCGGRRRRRRASGPRRSGVPASAASSRAA